ncbi:MAG: TIGR04076 family protein [Promethearchaeota archaeon]
MTWYDKILFEVVNILEGGKCPVNHQIGDKFSFPEDKGKICPYALMTLSPYSLALQSGGSFPWEENPDSLTLCCPDYNNPVVFKITRTESEDDLTSSLPDW